MLAAMKNMIWVLLAVFALSLAFLFSSPYAAFSIYAFLFLVGMANVSSRAWLAGLDCTRTISRTSIRQGDSVDISVTIHNKRGWPIPWIFMEDLYPGHCVKVGDNSRLAVLMPGRSISFDYTLIFPKRGYHRIGPLIMETGDLFGLQKRFRTGQQQEYVSVMPTIAYIDTFNVASKRPQGPVKASNKIYEDPTRLAGIREYELGDPMNRIDWKASARTGELFTKIYEPSSVQGGTLILDLHADSYVSEEAARRQELAITTAASMAYLLQISGEQLGLLTNGMDAAELAQYEVEAHRELSREDIEQKASLEKESTRISPLQVPTLKSPIQAQKIIDNLARIIPGYGLDASRLLMEEFRGLPRDATLIPIVPYVSEQFALTLAEMKLSGFSVTVFLIRDKKGYDEAAALLAQHQINVFHIMEESDLHEIAPQKIGHY
ncbi:MAG: hypothetical protein COA73_05885 [Candidatus Hydrogenedentota bacterium]|nr:MAG: hypothetical protein COA73_05885 [Candidatus Hydrogenedentota bacterium]